MCKKKKEQTTELKDINTDQIKTVNLKEYWIPQELEIKIKEEIDLVLGGVLDCVIFIHGYGEHKNGTHLILDRTRRVLSVFQSGLWVVPGEDFTVFNEGAREIRAKHAEFEQYLHVCNHGVTIIARKKQREKSLRKYKGW